MCKILAEGEKLSANEVAFFFICHGFSFFFIRRKINIAIEGRLSRRSNNFDGGAELGEFFNFAPSSLI